MTTSSLGHAGDELSSAIADVEGQLALEGLSIGRVKFDEERELVWRRDGSEWGIFLSWVDKRSNDVRIFEASLRVRIAAVPLFRALYEQCIAERDRLAGDAAIATKSALDFANDLRMARGEPRIEVLK